MDNQPQIKVTISPEGEIRYEVQGVQGQSCVEFSKFLDQLGNTTEVNYKPEYYENESVSVVQTTAY
jgi:hypothetical protein